MTEDKITAAMRQGQAQFDSIKEMVEALNTAEANPDDTDTIDNARQAIEEDALSVQVRSGWYSPMADTKPAEYEILLCTGGPACRIRGNLSEHGAPETAVLEVQDWFTPWTPMRPQSDPTIMTVSLLAYARCFWFGE